MHVIILFHESDLTSQNLGWLDLNEHRQWARPSLHMLMLNAAEHEGLDRMLHFSACKFTHLHYPLIIWTQTNPAQLITCQ